MDDLKSQKRFTVLIMVTLLCTFLSVLVVVLWYVLPIYAPSFVVQHAQWPGPIARVFVHEPTRYDSEYAIVNPSYLRLRKDFDDQALATLSEHLSSAHDAHVERALEGIGNIIEDKTDTVGGFIVQMISAGRASVDLSKAPHLLDRLCALLSHKKQRIVLQTIAVLGDLGQSASPAVPALQGLVASSSDKHIRILATACIAMLRTDHNMVNDVSGTVELMKLLAE